MDTLVEKVRPTLFRPRRLEPGEATSRDRIADCFPGGALGFSLDNLARLLGLSSGRLSPMAIFYRPAPAFEAGMAIAVSSSTATGSPRAVLFVPLDLAHRTVDMALRRGSCDRSRPGSCDRSRPGSCDRSRPLTSGEQGALLYALDQTGGDWLAAGGTPYVVRGFLAAIDQMADYLGGAPDWECVVRLAWDDLGGEVKLYFRDPISTGSAQSSRLPFLSSTRSWLVAPRIDVGWSRVSARDAADLEIGDLVLLDEVSHPDWKESRGVVTISCGQWRLLGRWLDRRRCEILSEEKRGAAMETETKRAPEVRAVLEQPDDSDVGSMEVMVQVEVGEVKMTVGKASGLVPGRILRLDRDVGPEVVLRVGAKRIGRGELVEHEGALAVEVKEVL
ncbi:MAG: hypothetical protein GY854_29065 [Deltaproteobacteria bacterium]|nr:hypothetical protein [Deltaproteobacteria bacterium]